MEISWNFISLKKWEPWILLTGGGSTMTRYTPPDQVHPPAQSMLGDTVNTRAVRILLECILVYKYHSIDSLARAMICGVQTNA